VTICRIGCGVVVSRVSVNCKFIYRQICAVENILEFASSKRRSKRRKGGLGNALIIALGNPSAKAYIDEQLVSQGKVGHVMCSASCVGL